MNVSTNHYINNKEFLKSLKIFQSNNWEDHSEWYTKVKPKNEQQRLFKLRCAERRNKRIEKLGVELPEQSIQRLHKLRKIKNVLGKEFLSITDGLMKKPNFINYDSNRKSDMFSDAIYYMTIYIDRYDCDRDNPFAYFTQIAFNAFRQNINKVKKNKEIFTSLQYLENLDSAEDVQSWD